MKSHDKETRSEHRHGIKALQEKMKHWQQPRGPFDYGERERAAQEAHAFYNEAVQLRRRYPHDSELCDLHTQASHLWHNALKAAYPSSFWDTYRRLRAGDVAGLESAVLFLEADPFFFGTEYVKEKLIRAIKRHMLTPNDSSCLQRVVLSLVDRRDGREFRDYCRLARKVDSPELREQLEKRLTHNDPNIARRARWVLEALCQSS